MIRIDSAEDPRVEEYRLVRERDLMGPGGRGGIFIGEQLLVVSKMLARPGVTKSVLVAPSRLEELRERVRPDEEVPVYVAPLEVMREIAGFNIHRGVLAAGFRPSPEQLTIDAVVPRRDGRLTVLLLERINNMDNVGLLFRNAAAFGADAVVLSPRCHDPLYRKSLRVSIGHALNVPWARSEDWHGDLDRLRAEWNLTLIAAATGERARPIDEIDRPERVGLIVGPEYEGLSERTLGRADSIARIPMAPGVDSLNVAVASAVCLHRFSRANRA